VPVQVNKKRGLPPAIGRRVELGAALIVHVGGIRVRSEQALALGHEAFSAALQFAIHAHKVGVAVREDRGGEIEVDRDRAAADEGLDQALRIGRDKTTNDGHQLRLASRPFEKRSLQLHRAK
jgi:hypothetical protein